MIATVAQPKTIGELSKETGLPEWLLRRTADSLGVAIPRIGPYRAIPSEIEHRLLGELRRRGKLLPAGIGEGESDA